MDVIGHPPTAPTVAALLAETDPLADALVKAVPTGPGGYRDDTTVAILRHPH